MKVKEEGEKVGSKHNIQKTKIMASGPITSWKIDGETMETMRDFIFLGSKITAEGDYQIRSDQISGSVVFDFLHPHEWQHTRLLCLSLSPGICSNSCPLSWWCLSTILSSVGPFSFLQSFLASRSLTVSLLLTSGGQSSGVSALASVLTMNIQDWFPSRLTGLVSFLSKGLSSIF